LVVIIQARMKRLIATPPCEFCDNCVTTSLRHRQVAHLVHEGLAGRILWAWIFTIPASAAIAVVGYFIARTGRVSRQARGRLKRKVEPLPGVLSTPTSPPMASTRFFTMDRPRPVPPISRERPGSTR